MSESTCKPEGPPVNPRGGLRCNEDRHRWTVLCLFGLLWVGGAGGQDQDAATSARHQLGRELFAELLFTNPAADYSASCAGCHVPAGEAAGRAERFYADWVPRSMEAMKGTTLRNAPALLDVEDMTALNRDGSFDSLEALIEAKLLGSMLGWTPADRERALDAIHFVLLHEGQSSPSGEPYVEQFAAAYDVDLEMLDRDEAVAQGVLALADYVRGIRSTGTARWDAFASMNRLRSGPIKGESPQSFAGEIIYSRMGNQEGRVLIKRPEGFTMEAYEGLKIFFTIAGESSVGNCVACHVPPTFTDNKFHNTGIAEAEYDSVHGAGAFRRLEIPGPGEAARPSTIFLSVPSEDRPGAADLGHWNWVDLEQSAQRDPQENESAFLARMVGAFKTPSLRNLSRTDPYMHNGAYSSLEDSVGEIVRINGLARAGELRGIAPEYLTMNLSDADIAPLVAFLWQLDEVGKENFRYYLIHLADDLEGRDSGQ